MSGLAIESMDAYMYTKFGIIGCFDGTLKIIHISGS